MPSKPISGREQYTEGELEGMGKILLSWSTSTAICNRRFLPLVFQWLDIASEGSSISMEMNLRDTESEESLLSSKNTVSLTSFFLSSLFLRVILKIELWISSSTVIERTLGQNNMVCAALARTLLMPIAAAFSFDSLLI